MESAKKNNPINTVIDVISGIFLPIVNLLSAAGILKGVLAILIVGFVTLALFGPIGAVIGDVLAAGYEFVYHLSPVIAGILLGAAVQPMVIFGFHWSFILIGMNNICLPQSGGTARILWNRLWPIPGQLCGWFCCCISCNAADEI